MPTSLSPTPLQWLESDSATKHPADIEEIYRHPPLRSSSSIPRHKKATHPARSNKDPGKAATSATSTMSKDQLHTVYALIRELAASGKKQKETQEKLRLERVKYATKLQNLQAHQSDRQIEVQELQRKLKKAITRLKTYRDHIKLLSKERKNILSSAGLMNMRPGSASNPEVTSIHGLDPPQEKPLLSNLKQHQHEALLPSDSKGMDLNGLKGDIDRLATLLNPLSGKANRAETLASHESAGTIPGKSKTESTDIGKRIVPADYPSDKCDLSNNKQSIYSPLGQSSSNRPSVQSNKDKIIPASVKSVDSTGSVSGISIPETHTESSAQPSSDLLPLLKKLRLQHHRKGRHRLSAASTSDIQQSRNIEHRDHVQTMANVGKPTSGNAISEDDDAWSAITPDYEGYELDEMLMNSRHKEADSDSTLSSDDTDRWISELEKSGDPTKGIGGRRKPESNLLVKQLLRESWKCADVTISQMNDTLDTPFCEDVATSHDVSVKISQDTPSKEHHTHPSVRQFDMHLNSTIFNNPSDEVADDSAGLRSTTLSTSPSDKITPKDLLPCALNSQHSDLDELGEICSLLSAQPPVFQSFPLSSVPPFPFKSYPVSRNRSSARSTLKSEDINESGIDFIIQSNLHSFDLLDTSDAGLKRYATGVQRNERVNIEDPELSKPGNDGSHNLSYLLDRETSMMVSLPSLVEMIERHDVMS